MRAFAFLILAAAIDLVAPSAFAVEKIRLAQSSTVTNCMMTCNSQAANCQTGCVLPSPPSSGGTTTTTNATGNTACILNCSSTQLTCQTNCGLQSR